MKPTEEHLKKAEEIINAWWYNLDENHRPYANETNKLISILKHALAEAEEKGFKRGCNIKFKFEKEMKK